MVSLRGGGSINFGLDGGLSACAGGLLSRAFMEASEARPGQRLVSDSEPELGLGILLRVDGKRVEVFFPAASEHRQYSLETAPLRRVRFKEGDRVRLHTGRQIVVERVVDKEGLLAYVEGAEEHPEATLADTISFSSPEERLLGGQTDESRVFDLRVEGLGWRSLIRRSPARGFVGGRMDLIPHQMYIASEVASRLTPRVLLADEVGLGKTIEAGLILHRMHLTGRAGRVLILLPETLVHQWFVELWRRFNLLFSIFDEERCVAIEAVNPGVNPFQDNQLVIVSLAMLAGDPARAAQVEEAGWDLLVVDEAHHLGWRVDGASPEYALVERLGRRVPGMLLLTATPQQLGMESHFARLRLLDPDRYSDLTAFMVESEHYGEVAGAVDRLLEGRSLSAKDRALFAKRSEAVSRECAALADGDEGARERLVRELLDTFGTGRVMFRNTRAVLSGFPERKAVMHKLKAGRDGRVDVSRIKWLAELLKGLGEEKVLLICSSRKLAERVSEDLQRELNVRCAVFHEGLNLMQRDRNAAFFAEPEGARVLICSEIGSEGRNFQFAHHLVMFDLPMNPELLEQRIGRLDRIGQKSTIMIHVPYAVGDASEVLARWYHEGLGAFERNVHGASEIAGALSEDLEECLGDPDPALLKALITKTRKLAAAVTRKLEKGQDRLLELNSCRAEQAASVIRDVSAADADRGFESFFIRVADHFGVSIEDMGGGHRSHFLSAGHLMKEALPGMPAEGCSVTFSRERAISREDVTFLSMDHPMAQGVLDMLLSGESGNTAFGVWKDSGREGLVLEVWFVAESMAPRALHADRFLPPTPFRVVVDHSGSDQGDGGFLDEVDPESGDLQMLLDQGPIRKRVLPSMIEKTKGIAGQKLEGIIGQSVVEMDQVVGQEIDRLKGLQRMNDHVRVEEVTDLEAHREALRTALTGAQVRIDALRLFHRLP